MATLTTLRKYEEEFLKGKGFLAPLVGAGPGATSAAGAAGGGWNFALVANGLGNFFPRSQSSTTIRLTEFQVACSSTTAGALIGWVYQIGTLNLAATGDQFTHDAGVYPMKRTIMGVSTAVPLMPFLRVAVQTATTAPQIIVKTAAGGAGYVDADGNSRVGTKTLVFPLAATVVGSTYHLMLNDGDSAIRDVSAIQVTTAASAGSAALFGFEPIAVFTGSPSSSVGVMHDALTGGLTASNLQPAVNTSGTPSFTGLYMWTTNVTNLAVRSWVAGAMDT